MFREIRLRSLEGKFVVSFSDLERFVQLSSGVVAASDLKRLMAETTAEMGFRYFALLHHVDLSAMRADLSHLETGSLLALHNYPASFTKKYIDRQWVRLDPVLMASQSRSLGFRWRDLGSLVEVGSHQRKIMIEAKRAGLGEGYTVPASVPGEPHGSCSFVTARTIRLPEESLLMAEMVAAFGFQAARTILQQRRPPSANHRHERLTTRQLECLVLVARGKSDWEIGQILGISQETVKHHIRLAREHYDVPTRIQAAIRAIVDRQLTIADVIS